MVELVLHDVEWCTTHGKPFLVLRTVGDDRYLAVATSTDDVQEMAPLSLPTARGRAYGLLETVLSGLGARLAAVDLAIAPDGHLGAAVRIEAPVGVLTVPTHFADAILLARRTGAPLLMADEEIERIPASAPPPRPPAPPLPTPFRQALADLDLDGFDTGDRSRLDQP